MHTKLANGHAASRAVRYGKLPEGTLPQEPARLPSRSEPGGSMMTRSAAPLLAGLRITMAFVFLWAFLDKTFGLGYSTSRAEAWIHGGSPAEGFLAHVEAGPMQGILRSWAGDPWADWLFMVGLVAIGVALLAGVAVRIAAAAGVAMMALMWIAEWPLAQHLSSGAASGSVNPIVDYHFVYAVVLVVLAATSSGAAFGLGRWWARLPVVRQRRWMR